jgi:hypothetical protein
VVIDPDTHPDFAAVTNWITRCDPRQRLRERSIPFDTCLVIVARDPRSAVFAMICG